MFLAGLDRKVAPADADHAFGTAGPEVGDLAVPDHPGEGVWVVTGDLGRFREGQQLVACIAERLLNLPGSPFQRASAALVAKNLPELRGFGAELRDTLLNGTLFRDHERTHPPKSSCLRGVLLVRAGDFMRGERQSQGLGQAVVSRIPKWLSVLRERYLQITLADLQGGNSVKASRWFYKAYLKPPEACHGLKSRFFQSR